MSPSNAHGKPDRPLVSHPYDLFLHVIMDQVYQHPLLPVVQALLRHLATKCTGDRQGKPLTEYYYPPV